MTFRQMAEIGTAVATSLAVLLIYALVVVFVQNTEYRSADANEFAIVLLGIWLCSLMVAIGAYFNTTRQSNLGLIGVWVGAIMITVVLGFWGLMMSIFGGPLFGLLFLAPVGLALSTAVLAVFSRTKSIVRQI